MAVVLCTGVDPILVRTRVLILERAGHTVVPALSGRAVQEFCRSFRFDVAVIGQAVTVGEKQMIYRLLREESPRTKVLELYAPVRGRDLPEADDWLEVPVDVPLDLEARIRALAAS